MSTKLDLTQFAGFTPGPWESPGNDGGDRVVCATVNGKRRTLAHFYGGADYSINEPQRDENGILAAAAPALLSLAREQQAQIEALRAALREAVVWWDDRQPDYEPNPEFPDPIAPWRAALAASEGK